MNNTRNLSKSEIISQKVRKNKNYRQWHICRDCFICDDDLVLALNRMSDASLIFVVKKSLAILKNRKLIRGSEE